MRWRAYIGVFAKFVAFTALYVLAGRLGRRVDFLSEELRVFWPQAGIGLAGLILLGWQYWPAIALGSFLNSTLILDPLSLDKLLVCLKQGVDGNLWDAVQNCLFTRDPGTYALAPYLALGNTLAPLVATLCLKHFSRFDPLFSRLHDVYSFCLYAVLLSPILSAAIAVYRFLQVEPGVTVAGSVLFLRRWVGFAISNLVVAPVILTWSHKPRGRWPVKRLLELTALLTSLAGLAWMAFTRTSPIGQLNYPVSFAPFPLVMWAALRFGPRGGATATFLISALAVYGTSEGAGPFLREITKDESLVLLQIYLMVLALTALLLGAASSERLRSITELEHSREELRELSERLVRVREEERLHLAREIHDDLGQILTGIKMRLRRLVKNPAPTVEQQTKQLEQLTELVDEAIQSVRRVASDLRPGILDDLGLVEAMKWALEQFRQQTNIEASFEPPEDLPRPSQATEITLLRILQEALTNVARHSQATHVWVRIRISDGSYELEVRDNGIGLPGENDPARPQAGLGIVGMRERALSLGGSFEIFNGLDYDGFIGTLLRVRVPVDTRD